jgi:WD40 repeat protein
MVEEKTHYHVFLSHNSEDKAAVEPLAVMLREKGLNPFLDKWNLVPGEPIEDALIEALENSDSAVIFVGPGGEGPWQSEEMRDILKRAVKSHNEFRAIPVLLPNASAGALEKSFLSSRLWIEFKDVDDEDALLRLVKAIKGEAYGDESFALPDEPAPYRGLERFERIEKPEEDFFFGRDNEIRALIERLVKERFVAVVGASGSGKSSLIRAGLSKQLAEDIYPGIRRWQTITVEPGSTPFRALAVQIAVAAGIGVADRESWIDQTIKKWRVAPDGVRRSLDALFADAKEPLLVFIDQFEELFTHRREGVENERISRNFVANLADLWRNGGDRVRVVVALRADFVERCLEIGELKELLQDRTMLVGEVGDDALREIVKEPAARVGAFLEKGLMERILTEVRNQSGSLPLLQQALHGLWRNRRGAWLTHDALDASGGIARALNDQAQGAYKSLDDAQKKIADSLFPRLITLGEGVADTRRRVRRNELYPQGVEPAVVNAVIDRLSGKDARILVTTREGGTADDLGAGKDFVEFTHEALLANWDHLVTLLDSERESIRKHRSLTSAAEVWESKPEAKRQKFLLHHGQLEIAEQWAADEAGDARLNQTERLFLDQSIQEREADQAERKAQRRREVEEETKGRRRGWAATFGVALALVTAVFGYFVFIQKQEATKNLVSANIERARASAEKGDGIETLFSLLNAYDAATEGDRRSASALGLIGARAHRFGTPLHHKTPVTFASFRSDGKRVLTLTDDNTVHMWDVAPSEEVSQLKVAWGDVKSAAFGPDGKSVLIAGEVTIANILDLKSGARALLDLSRQTLELSAFSPDGARILVTGGSTASIWDVEFGTKLKEFKMPKDHRIGAAVFNQDGARVLTKGEEGKTISIWDIESGTKIKEFEVPKDMGAAVFNQDGARVLIKGEEGKTISIWDVEGGTKIKEFEVPKNHRIFVAAFSPEGVRVLILGKEKTVSIWNVNNNVVTPVLDVESFFKDWSSRGPQVVFSPDGTKVLIAVKEKYVRISNVDGAFEQFEVPKDHHIVATAFGPDGAHVLIEGEEGKTVSIWNVKSDIVTPVHDVGSATTSSMDGAHVLTTSKYTKLHIWDTESNKETAVPGFQMDSVKSIVFSPDGRRVLVTSYGKPLRIWNVKSGTEVHARVERNRWESRDFKLSADEDKSTTLSPDGKRVFTVGKDNTARIGDVETGEDIARLKISTDPVIFKAFSPDGSRVLFTTLPEDWQSKARPKGGTVWLYDLDERKSKPYPSFKEAISSPAFRPDETECVERPHFLAGVENQKGSRSWSIVRWCEGRLWDLEKGTPLLSGTSSLVTSLDGKRILTEEGGESTLPQHLQHERTRGFLTASPDGAHVLTADRSGKFVKLQLWETQTGNHIRTIDVMKVNTVSISPDGKRIATVGGNPGNWPDFPPRVWDVETRALIFKLEGKAGHTEITVDTAWSPDGRRISTTSSDGTTRLWDAESGLLVNIAKVSPTAWPNDVVFSPDGTLTLSTTRDGYARLSDVETGMTVEDFRTSNSWSTAAAFSPDGKRVAIGNGYRHSPGKGEVWLLHPPACNDPEWLRLSIEIRTGHAWDDKIERTYALTYDELKAKQKALQRKHGGKFCDTREWSDLTEE